MINQKTKSEFRPGSNKHQNSFSPKKNFDAGFTLLFASLIGSLVFTIGIAILNISLKQLTLASASRESQQSFYSADTGIECALILDRGAGDEDCRDGFFGIASSTSSGIAVCGKDMDEYILNKSLAQKCFGLSIDTIDYSQSEDAVTSTFSITDNPDTDICFSISVTKIPNSDLSDINSVIESRGYNTCRTTGAVYERAIKTYNY